MLLELYRRYGPLKVLASSDSSSDMVAEMRAAGGAFRKVFQSSHWHYLDYPRDDFSYPEAAAQRKSGEQPFIEFISDKRQQATSHTRRARSDTMRVWVPSDLGN